MGECDNFYPNYQIAFWPLTKQGILVSYGHSTAQEADHMTNFIDEIQADTEYRADMLDMLADDYQEWVAMQEEEARMLEIERQDAEFEVWFDDPYDGESCPGLGDDYYIEGWPD
jgi:hypothetical protein